MLCPICDASIDVQEDELDEGESLICEECGAELTVTGLDPLELEPSDEEDEDEDAEDDFASGGDKEDVEDEEAEDEEEEDWK